MKPRLLDKILYSYIILETIKGAIIPEAIDPKDWKNHKKEIIEQFIGSGIEAGVFSYD